jgi:hypothetical protein
MRRRGVRGPSMNSTVARHTSGSLRPDHDNRVTPPAGLVPASALPAPIPCRHSMPTSISTPHFDGRQRPSRNSLDRGRSAPYPKARTRLLTFLDQLRLCGRPAPLAGRRTGWQGPGPHNPTVRINEPEDQLGLVLIVRPAAQGDVVDGGWTVLRVCLDVMELEERPLRAPPPAHGEEGTLAAVAFPGRALDRSWYVS